MSQFIKYGFEYIMVSFWNLVVQTVATNLFVLPSSTIYRAMLPILLRTICICRRNRRRMFRTLESSLKTVMVQTPTVNIYTKPSQEQLTSCIQLINIWVDFLFQERKSIFPNLFNYNTHYVIDNYLTQYIVKHFICKIVDHCELYLSNI